MQNGDQADTAQRHDINQYNEQCLSRTVLFKSVWVCERAFTGVSMYIENIPRNGTYSPVNTNVKETMYQTTIYGCHLYPLPSPSLGTSSVWICLSMILALKQHEYNSFFGGIFEPSIHFIVTLPLAYHRLLGLLHWSSTCGAVWR